MPLPRLHVHQLLQRRSVVHGHHLQTRYISAVPRMSRAGPVRFSSVADTRRRRWKMRIRPRSLRWIHWAQAGVADTGQHPPRVVLEDVEVVNLAGRRRVPHGPADAGFE